MFIGFIVIFPHYGIRNIGNLDTTAYQQLAFVFMVSLVILFLLPGSRALRNLRHVPICLLLIYGYLGIMSVIYSPYRALSFYKGLLIVIDSILVCLALRYLDNANRKRTLLNITYFLYILLCIMALLGVVIVPEKSLLPAKGAIGLILHGGLFFGNPNGIGFIGALTVIISFRRIFENLHVRRIFFWLTLLCCGFMVMYLAQARTAWISIAIILPFLSLSIVRLRWTILPIILVLLLVCGYNAATSKQLAWDKTVYEYAIRGQEKDPLKTLIGRANFWMHAGLQMINDAPLLGHGFDAGVKYDYDIHMHNSHFQILSNSGFLGYIAWLGMVFLVTLRVAKRLFKHYLSAKTEDGRFHVEMTGVLMLILLRTITGSIIVIHEFALLLFLSIMTNSFLVEEKSSESL